MHVSMGPRADQVQHASMPTTWHTWDTHNVDQAGACLHSFLWRFGAESGSRPEGPTSCRVVLVQHAGPAAVAVRAPPAPGRTEGLVDLCAFAPQVLEAYATGSMEKRLADLKAGTNRLHQVGGGGVAGAVWHEGQRPRELILDVY